MGIIFSNCSDDNDDFKGVDNAITSFILTKDNVEYIGSIKNNFITISLPENESLYGSVVKIELSENATMIPDPSTITNWDEEFRFSIKAYNGESTFFTYSPIFTPITSEVGDIYLETQEEVDAFVSKTDFPSIIDGSLILGKMSGEDEDDIISDISGLSRIKEIRNNLVINPTFSVENLSDFINLKKFGGLNIKSTQRIKTIEFESIVSVAGDLSIVSSSLQTVSFPKLTKVNGTFSMIANTINQISLPLLETIGGNLSFTNGNTSTIEILSMPNLITLNGKFILQGFSKLKTCDLAKLEKCGNGIDINSLSGIEELEFPSLTSCGTLLKIYNSSMTIISFPVLKESGSIDFMGLGTLSSVIFDELETVTGDFKFQSWRSPFVYKLRLPKLKKVSNNVDFITTFGANYYTIEEIHMPKLEEIGSTLKIYVGYAPTPNTSLKTLDFSSLVKVGKIDISNQSLLSDFSTFGKLIPNIESTQWAVTGCKYNPTYENMVGGNSSGN